MHSFVFKRLIYASRFSNQHASSHVFFTMTANSSRHLDICSYILHLLDKFIMSQRGEDGSGVGPQGSQSLTHCQDQPAQQTNRYQMQTLGIFLQPGFWNGGPAEQCEQDKQRLKILGWWWYDTRFVSYVLLSLNFDFWLKVHTCSEKKPPDC